MLSDFSWDMTGYIPVSYTHLTVDNALKYVEFAIKAATNSLQFEEIQNFTDAMMLQRYTAVCGHLPITTTVPRLSTFSRSMVRQILGRSSCWPISNSLASAWR